MLRILILTFLAIGLARASDPIIAPALGASALVTQPHVTAELIPETTAAQAGQPFDVALHLHADAGWHTYWINPGDAGLATRIVWTLPNGFTAGPIQWPTPEKHNMGPLVTYGYGGDVYLLTTITPPKDNLPQHFEIKAKASWLVCQEECIPGKGEFTIPMDSGLMNLRLPQNNEELFKQAWARVPVGTRPPGPTWDVTGIYATAPAFPGTASSKNGILIHFPGHPDKGGTFPLPLDGNLRFFPEQPNVLSTQDADNLPEIDDLKTGSFTLPIALQQNGDKPKTLSGVLVSDKPIAQVMSYPGPNGGSSAPLGPSNAIYISSFPVTSEVAAAGAAKPQGDPVVTGPVAGNAPAGSSEAAQTSAFPSATWERGNSKGGSAAPPLGTGTPDAAATSDGSASAVGGASAGGETTLIAVLGAAFIGGLILNLMPCVLPVLSLKVFSLMKHAGENAKSAWIQGVAFTAGVLISFWALAGVLILLRTAGNHLGWGFQMQDPRFVLFLILLFFMLALNLFGVFELGASLVGLDAKTAGRMHGTASSFGNGALATLAATPCTAPFMGSALGFAAQQPAYVSLLIFTFLALGMAAPYLLLTLFPGALKFVPKPGAWMEAFKQLMGFLLMGTVIFLVYVFGALTGEDQVPWLLFVLLLAGLAAWIYGKWATPMNSNGVRAFAYLLTIGVFGYAIFWGVSLANAAPPMPTSAATTETSEAWQPWTQEAVDAALAKGQPVFVDFTAAWCLSCKVNERVALGTDAVKKAFAGKNVALFKADWTHADPEISKTLQKFNRDGVPLYLVYSPKNATTPQVLPEVLTPSLVLDALAKL